MDNEDKANTNYYSKIQCIFKYNFLLSPSLVHLKIYYCDIIDLTIKLLLGCFNTHQNFKKIRDSEILQ